MPDPQTLAQLIRAKYPDAYKDMSDQQLEAAIVEKYPQYGDMPRTSLFAGSGLKEPLNLPSEGVKQTSVADTLAAVPGNVLKGFSAAIQHPIDTAVNIGKQSFSRLQKSADAASRGDIPEAVGQELAAIPVLGEMGAQPAEQARSGDVTGGLTNLGVNLAGLALPEVAGMVPTGLAKGARMVGRGIMGEAGDTALANRALPLTPGNTIKLRALEANTKPITGYEDYSVAPGTPNPAKPIYGESPHAGVADAHAAASAGIIKPSGLGLPLPLSIAGQAAHEVSKIPSWLYSSLVRSGILAGLGGQQ